MNYTSGLLADNDQMVTVEGVTKFMPCIVQKDKRKNHWLPYSEVNTSLAMIDACIKSYEKYRKINFESINLKPVMKINNKKTDTQGFVAVNNQGDVVVAFRGSQTLRDWFDTDFDISFKRYHRAMIHKGFYKALKSVYHGILPYLDQQIKIGKAIYITGHSLGGALAAVLAFRLKRDYPDHVKQLKLYTFGSPYVGNKRFAKEFNEMESYDITIIRDPISYNECPIPSTMRSFGYKKTPRQIFLPRKGDHSKELYKRQLKKMRNESNYIRLYKKKL
jgi:predicted lipase